MGAVPKGTVGPVEVLYFRINKTVKLPFDELSA